MAPAASPFFAAGAGDADVVDGGAVGDAEVVDGEVVDEFDE